MKMRMKEILMMTLITATANAGGSGGGGVLSSTPNDQKNHSAEYVRYVGEDRGEVIFDRAKQVQNAEVTKIDRYKKRPEEFKSDESVIQDAVQSSKSSKDWKRIK